MRANLLALTGSAILILLGGTTEAIGQQTKGPSPVDEQKEILSKIDDAYKAPTEVPQDIMKELRKAYQQPSEEREAKVFKEIRRLYLPTAEQEENILREIRRAYQQPTVEQEERIFRAIRQANPLPAGTVPPSVQSDQAGKLFRKLDMNGDGVLSADEMSDGLRGGRGRWDTNRDGRIDSDEYWIYYQGLVQSLTEGVASGQIPLKSGPVKPNGSSVPTITEEPRSTVIRAGKLPPGLPPWFSQFDTDGDAQVGLYEWKKSGRPLQEFFDMDRNGDGFVTVNELLSYLARPGTQVNPTGKR